MTADLYFIPLIARALRKPRPRAALYAAFQEIRDSGRQNAYAIGWRQFLEFCAAMAEAPSLEAGGSSMADVLCAAERAAPLQILLRRNGQTVCALAVEGTAATVGGIHPGSYQLCTETGWVLWEGTLIAPQVYWAEAFPGRNLPMAAQTEEAAPQPTLEIPLLEGTLLLQIHAGLDAAVLTLIPRLGSPRP